MALCRLLGAIILPRWLCSVSTTAGESPVRTLFATMLLVVVGIITSADARAERTAADVAGVQGYAGRFVEGVESARVWIGKRYDERPALMIGLAAGLSLPVFTLAGLLVYRRRREEPSDVPDLELSSVPGPADAWIEVDGVMRVAMPEMRDLLQIGRHEDNDIQIEDESVHRYHAVIERSMDQGFVIVDISGPDGNGLVINGERLARAALADGDTVELGRSKLKFGIAA